MTYESGTAYERSTIRSFQGLISTRGRKDQEAENGVHEIAAHNASYNLCGGPRPLIPDFLLCPSADSSKTQPPTQCSRLKPSMPFKRDLALQNIPLLTQPFKTQPQIENEDVT